MADRLAELKQRFDAVAEEWKVYESFPAWMRIGLHEIQLADELKALAKEIRACLQERKR